MKARFDYERLTGEDVRRISAGKMTVSDTIEFLDRVTVGGASHLSPDAFNKLMKQIFDDLWGYVAELLDKRDAAKFDAVYGDVSFEDIEERG